MHRNKSANVHQFSMIPRADIPRSAFPLKKAYKTTFDAGILYPIFCEEILPGDTWNVKMTAFARLATPIVPFMDNLHMESFFFFVPNRLVWENWQRFMGERDPDPDSSIDYLVPQIVFGSEQPLDALSIYDYMGIPIIDVTGGQLPVNSLAFRAYNLIWNEWFRDQNLQDSVPRIIGDGPDAPGDFQLLRRGKRHDYFTSCLPWTQKGNPVQLPLGSSAPVYGNGTALGFTDGSANEFGMYRFAGGSELGMAQGLYDVPVGGGTVTGAEPTSSVALGIVQSPEASGLVADLSAATAATINSIRQAFQIQKLLERDARGGTRYTEIIFSHFGVKSPDARLQRPEYLGGGHTPVVVNPVAATSGQFNDVGVPVGNLGAMGTALAHSHGFTQSFTEHGYVIGLISVRADLTYQQGLRRHWSRRTRYDYYFPVFAMLGEQAVLNKEIYATADAEQDNAVFGYQERWAEYRYLPSEITALMRSSHPQSLDVWHLSQEFESAPQLAASFIEDHPPVDRVIATDNMAGTSQFLLDVYFGGKMARPMPVYSVPGLVDHF